MTIPFNTVSDRWKADPEFREAYERVSPEMDIAFAVAAARHHAKLTQVELARRVGTSQSMVARWETGRSAPSTSSLRRVAEATGTRLHVELVPA